MATQGTNTSSRLTQMQMRFQARQQQEREQRRSEQGTPTRQVETVLKPSPLDDEGSKKLAASLGAGKVRQMFDERRHRVTGIDRSFPLEPLPPRAIATVANTTTITKGSVNNVQRTKVTTVRQIINGADSKTVKLKPVSVPLQKPKQLQKDTTIAAKNDTTFTISNEQYFEENANVIEQYDISRETFPEIEAFDDDFMNGNVVLEKMASPISQKATNNHKNNLKPQSATLKNTLPHVAELTGRTATMGLADQQRKPLNTNKKIAPLNRAGANIKLSSTVTERRSNAPEKSVLSSPAKQPIRTSAKSATKSSPLHLSAKSSSSTPQRMSSPKVVPHATSSQQNDKMSACQTCGRFFDHDRVAKHETICAKTTSKNRKVFDAAKHRVQGTEAEGFLKKTSKTQVNRARVSNVAPTSSQAEKDKKNDWRRKHDEFIQTIREAKKVQQYLAKGGKLSDLPPPPPSENPDYIQCPHCSRRFNETAATRHIPKCKTMFHNKPKPAPAKKRF